VTIKSMNAGTGPAHRNEKAGAVTPAISKFVERIGYYGHLTLHNQCNTVRTVCQVPAVDPARSA